jgi:uncharacterized membrane protein
MEKSKVRFEEIDGLRGLAIIQMVAYHFCYDLNYFGWVRWPLGRGFGWVFWQTSIVSTFLLLVGISLVLRSTFKPAWRDFWQRWIQIAVSALLVSLGSYFIFPESYIFFGILHCIAITLMVGRILLFVGTYNLVLGGGAIALGLGFANPMFNPRALSWLGFITERPFSEDYVPIFPWLGLVLMGCGLGSIWRNSGFRIPKWVISLRGHIPHWLIQTGKHSLAIYLVHQPILLGILFAVNVMLRKS